MVNASQRHPDRRRNRNRNRHYHGKAGECAVHHARCLCFPDSMTARFARFVL